MTKEWWVLAAFLSLCFVSESIGSYFTALSVTDWYPTLNKPFWNPPGWLFGPVWTFLYASMGIAAWLVWKTVGKISNAPLAFFFFLLQLVVNTVWSLFFFTWKNPVFALYDVILLDVLVLITTYLFWRIYKPAGYLMLPYLAWILYATSLNAYIAFNN
ncbi:MAG: TspO/MBR family protein [Parachlamydiales bacterium]|jgi:tryptophan-rich sensory protein